MRKNCSSDRENLLKFEAEGREFAKFFRSHDPKKFQFSNFFDTIITLVLEQFIQTVKGQNNFW